MPRPIRHTPLMRQIEQQWSKPIDVLIPELFREEGSMPKVADRLGVAYTTAYFWARKFGIVAYEPPKVRFPREEASGQVE